MNSGKRLRARWSKREQGVLYDFPSRPDGYLAHTCLCALPIYPAGLLRPQAEGPSFLDELERRGYDLTTLKFSVDWAEPHAWIRAGALLRRKADGYERRVDWVRWRKGVGTVFFETGAKLYPGGVLSSRHDGINGFLLIEVERDYEEAR